MPKWKDRLNKGGIFVVLIVSIVVIPFSIWRCAGGDSFTQLMLANLPSEFWSVTATIYMPIWTFNTAVFIYFMGKMEELFCGVALSEMLRYRIGRYNIYAAAAALLLSLTEVILFYIKQSRAGMLYLLFWSIAASGIYLFVINRQTKRSRFLENIRNAIMQCLEYPELTVNKDARLFQATVTVARNALSRIETLDYLEIDELADRLHISYMPQGQEFSQKWFIELLLKGCENREGKEFYFLMRLMEDEHNAKVLWCFLPSIIQSYPVTDTRYNLYQVLTAVKDKKCRASNIRLTQVLIDSLRVRGVVNSCTEQLDDELNLLLHLERDRDPEFSEYVRSDEVGEWMEERWHLIGSAYEFTYKEYEVLRYERGWREVR